MASLCLLQQRGQKLSAAEVTIDLVESLSSNELQKRSLALEALDRLEVGVQHTAPCVPVLVSAACLLIPLVLEACSCKVGALLAGQRGLRVLWLGQWLLATIDMTILTPISYDLAKQLGYGAVSSGFLLAAPQVLQPMGAILSRIITAGQSYSFQRRLIIGSLYVQAILTWLLVPVLHQCNHWGSEVVLGSTILLRSVAGMTLMLYGVPLSTNVYASAAPAERSCLSMELYLSMSLGVCLGPFLSSLLLSVGHYQSSQACGAGQRAVQVMALLWCCETLLAVCVLPYELKEGINDGTNAREQDRADSQLVEELPEWLRKTLVGLTIVFSAGRSLGISAIEVATALLLESQYGWTPEKIGYGLGTVFALTASVGLLVALVRNTLLSEYVLMMLMAICSVLGSLLFFDFGAMEAREGRHSSPVLLMAADMAVYACMFQLTAFMEGIATQAAVPGSTFCLENFIVVRNLAIQMPRAIGPLVARWMIEAFGRNVYAGFMLCLTTGAVWAVWFAAGSARSSDWPQSPRRLKEAS
mmetsp:Transcript_42318/g.78823  ORF Transcript_42318/g.78823 Transcript_42318/m.78823 type:complete len:529 (+) Transcript_42318:97-1683(+)